MHLADSTSLAADYLRQAIPLMVRHRIPPHPVNYAIWYTYVSGRLPELNAQLERILGQFNGCPPGLEARLFRDYLIQDEFKVSDRIHSSLISVATSLTESTSEALESNCRFSRLLEESLEALNATADAGGLQTVAQALSSSAAAMTDTTQRFQHHLGCAQEEIERLRAELEQARDDVFRDGLTRLYNRRYLDQALQHIVASPDTPRCCLMAIDLDHFKKLNDTYGHVFGDKVLEQVARLLEAHCGEDADALRYGGEEFMVLCYQCDPEEAILIAEELRRRISSIRIRHRQSGAMIDSISASLGVAMLQPDDSVEDFLERADRLLYQAKAGGRNQVAFSPHPA